MLERVLERVLELVLELAVLPARALVRRRTVQLQQLCPEWLVRELAAESACAIAAALTAGVLRCRAGHVMSFRMLLHHKQVCACG